MFLKCDYEKHISCDIEKTKQKMLYQFADWRSEKSLSSAASDICCYMPLCRFALRRKDLTAVRWYVCLRAVSSCADDSLRPVSLCLECCVADGSIFGACGICPTLIGTWRSRTWQCLQAFSVVLYFWYHGSCLSFVYVWGCS